MSCQFHTRTACLANVSWL